MPLNPRTTMPFTDTFHERSTLVIGDEDGNRGRRGQQEHNAADGIGHERRPK